MMRFSFLTFVLVISIFPFAWSSLISRSRAFWTPWSQWSMCNPNNNNDLQLRSRRCIQHYYRVQTCPGFSRMKRRCFEYGAFVIQEEAVSRRSRFENQFSSFRNSVTDDCYNLSEAYQYRGKSAHTATGVSCQNWLSTSPHFHAFSPFRYSGSGIGNHNYCRSPNHDSKPWCFTVNPFRRWEYCFVPVCQNFKFKHEEIFQQDNCFTAGSPGLYRGCQNITRSGIPCKEWNLPDAPGRFYTSHRILDKGLGKHNYCRSPDGVSRLWCYTVDPKVKWEYCNVPECAGNHQNANRQLQF